MKEELEELDTKRMPLELLKLKIKAEAKGNGEDVG